MLTVSYSSRICTFSYNPFSSLMPDFLKKKKESTPVPASSQRQQQTPLASTSSNTEVAAPTTSSANTETTVNASEDIFAQVDKLEEDLGISHKKKAKEVCDKG